ncbi:hypothetical protein LX97_01655 [Nonlabens dokdonensis]|uniref:Uncharacterized protein n=2 Tax=Nonlabens dokdonensis TaxID=328515 RepID=A0ABX5PYH1_9FLAO|nr:hypothetical protein [Nonlabens dokdonensis]AGC77356.1 putative YapH protein [Nonlabens dokdonensis DSW-6]PZX40882.1 hypothetical protein LX97_01655 [Nonlabens dokdonensis]
MKSLRIFLLVCASLSLVRLDAQVGIQNDNPQATLDISAGATVDSNDGLLIPRIENFPLIDPGAAQNGMLVFLETASTGNTAGFYFWNNSSTSWEKLGEGGFWSQGSINDRPYIFYQDAQTNNSIPLRIFEDGYVGLGAVDEPRERLELRFEGDNDVQLTSSFPANPPNLIYYNQGGTFESPEFLRRDEPIGYTVGKTWDGDDQSGDIIGIQFDAANVHTATSLPTKMRFAVTNVDEVINEVQMTLESSGELQLTQLNSTNNVANDGVRPVPVFVNVNGGFTLNGDSQILVEPSVKYTNSDITTNLNVDALAPANTAVGFNLPVIGNLQWNDDTNLYQVGSSGQFIRVNEAGRYNIVGNIYFRGNAPGASLKCYVVIEPANGDPDYVASSIYANSYIGGSFNHNLSSISFTEDIEIDAGDILSIRVKGNGNQNATITMETAGSSMLQLTKIR